MSYETYKETPEQRERRIERALKESPPIKLTGGQAQTLARVQRRYRRLRQMWMGL